MQNPFRRLLRSKKSVVPTDIEKRHILGLNKQRIPSIQQLSYLPKYLSVNERFWIKALTGIIIACLLTLGIRYWQTHIVWVPDEGGTYTEGMIGAPRFINPVLAIGNTTDSDLTRIFFPGLLTTNTANDVVPDLAESYSMSDDLKTYTFILRKGLLWDDGEPLTIDDVMYTFQLIQDPQYASPWRSTFADAAFTRTDDRTLTVTLKQPSALFIKNFVIGILPLHRFSDVPASSFLLLEDNTRPVGDGPFKFSQLVRSKSGDIKSIELVRNPNYHGKLPYLDKVQFRFYGDVASAIEGMRNREVDGVAFVPGWVDKDAQRISRVNKEPLILPQVSALFFNLKNEILKKKDVRRALVLGLDRERITRDIFGGDAFIAEGPFAPGFIGFVPDLAARPRIVSEANTILDNAGYKRGADGIRKNGNDNLRFVITTIDQQPYSDIAKSIQSDWKELGIEVEIQLTEPGRLTQDVIRPRRYDMLLYGELLDATLDPYAFWDSSQALDPGLNFSIFVNKQVDALLEQAQAERDLLKRHQLYQQVQRIIADEIPAIFINTPVYDYYLAASVQGVTTGNMATPSDRFSSISSWFKRVKPAFKADDK